MTHYNLLKEHFGYDSFRPGQELLVNSILKGQDVLGIMPTGAGKSICFQLPALMLEGVTLIVSPLISLMKDQVNALTQAGINAAFINSSLTERQIGMVVKRARNGEYKLIYIAPERLMTYDFIELARDVRISMLTVDEAHCISQWGQDFRPSYSTIPEFIDKLPTRPIVSAFTATATPRVREDIIQLLNLKSPEILVTGFDRENLYFEVQKPRDKFQALTEFLKDKQDRCGIVYCSTRKLVEEVCEKLNEKGYSASRYHAGLSDSERHENQDDFLYDRARIMVATNAFGMGIDKSNVSFVVHYNMPKDIESYYQEAGRAGRDGGEADCILLYSGQDVRTNLWLIENSRDRRDEDTDFVQEEGLSYEELIERDRKRLREMTFYCTTTDCLRGYILRYFGETPQNFCGNCSSCNTHFETVDVTVESQKILSCVYRMRERYGVNMIIAVLRGSKNEKVLRLGLDKLSTYGISQSGEKQLRDIINHLILGDYLVKTDDEYPVIKLGQHANSILRGGETVVMKLSKEIERSESTRRQDNTPIRPVDKGLFTALRELRTRLAKEQGVPSYVVFSDSSLTDMCMKLPKTQTEMLSVLGVGKAKLERYGDLFIAEIAGYLKDSPIDKVAYIDEQATAVAAHQSTIERTDEAVTIKVIADRISSLLIQRGQKRITAQKLNDWLILKGYLTKITENDKNHKIPTERGLKIGITCEERDFRGEKGMLNLYSKSAQEIIIESMDELLEFCG